MVEIEYKYRARFAREAREMREAGLRDCDIAAAFNIHPNTIAKWRDAYPDFREALPKRQLPKVPRKKRRAAAGADPKEKYRAPMVVQVREMRAAGLTVAEIARAFGVTHSTLTRWASKYPAFEEALALGQEAAKKRIEESLYQRAVGYETEREKVAFDKDGNVRRATYVEHVPADLGAIKYWLGNRAPDDWRERQTIEHSGSIGLPEQQARQQAISDLLAELRAVKRADPALSPPEGSDLL